MDYILIVKISGSILVTALYVGGMIAVWFG